MLTAPMMLGSIFSLPDCLKWFTNVLYPCTELKVDESYPLTVWDVVSS